MLGNVAYDKQCGAVTVFPLGGIAAADGGNYFMKFII
jgi:hypothetical protein